MKTYACPFCETKLNKKKLVVHIDKNHDTELATTYPGITAYHLVYDIVNDHPDHHGRCCICNNLTNWNTKTQKYFRICKNPECAKKVREQYKQRMMKIYNKTTLLDDPKHQEKMLANRRISGKYKWSDGTIYIYTGTYEKNLLEFLDKTMNYDSKDIVMPGPILQYDHNGVKRHWITDCMILSLKLIIEIKDGGNNPNKKNMSITREKTLCKEKMITNQGVYHYIRLTNNDFGQLLSILAELKMNMIEGDDSRVYRIHEDAELNDMDEYQEQDEASDICEDIYDYVDSNYSTVVDISYENAEFDEDEEDDIDVYLACILRPKLINKDHEDKFKNIVDNIITAVGRAFPEHNIISYWIDEEDYTRGKAIGIEKTSINESLLYEEPLRYQSTSYDCANAAIMNAASYISDFTEIPPIFLKKVNEVCLDKCTDVEMKGTSRDAVKHIAYWLNEYSNENNFFIKCKIYEGPDVTFLNNSELLNDIKRPNTAVVLLCNLYDEHWVTITDADNNYLYLFDPYYWNEGYNDTKIKYINEPFKANRKIPIDFMETTNGIYYSLKPIENKLAVVFENISKV